LSKVHVIDTELVSRIIAEMHFCKAPHMAGLTAEHLKYSHPSLIVLLLLLCIPATSNVALKIVTSFLFQKSRILEQKHFLAIILEV